MSSVDTGFSTRLLLVLRGESWPVIRTSDQDGWGVRVSVRPKSWNGQAEGVILAGAIEERPTVTAMRDVRPSESPRPELTLTFTSPYAAERTHTPHAVHGVLGDAHDERLAPEHRPVVLRSGSRGLSLRESSRRRVAAGLAGTGGALDPYAPEPMTLRPRGTFVNQPANDESRGISRHATVLRLATTTMYAPPVPLA